MASLHRHASRFCCVLDFDQTIAERDCAEWVTEFAGFRPLYDDLRLRHGLSDHAAMNEILLQIPLPTIHAALRCLPILPDTLLALRSASSAGVELRILSDANSYFIHTVLRHHRISHLFASVQTNPAWTNAAGRLRYRSFAATPSPDPDFCCGAAAADDPLAPPPAMPSHACQLCPPNLCKGDVLAATVLSRGSVDTVVYGGDGSGDLCPGLRLPGPEHILLPRVGFPLHGLLPLHGIRATVRPWRSLAAALWDALLLHPRLPLIPPPPSRVTEQEDEDGAAAADDADLSKAPESLLVVA